MEFIVPKNYKRGKYILNRFRSKDIIVITSVLSVCLLLLLIVLSAFSKYLSVQQNLLVVFIILLPIFIVYILYTPRTVHLNYLTSFQAMIKFNNKQKIWLWQGVDKYEEK